MLLIYLVKSKLVYFLALFASINTSKTYGPNFLWLNYIFFRCRGDDLVRSLSLVSEIVDGLSGVLMLWIY
jgi:hypothetical protein